MTTSIVRSVLQAPAGQDLASDITIVVLGFSHRGFGHVALVCWFHSDVSEPLLVTPMEV